MDLLTMIFVFALFIFSLFLTLIIRRDFIARQQRRRDLRQQRPIQPRDRPR